jgi:hypothetical protein
MTWVKLDDGFLTNPKIMRAGLEGRALYVAGLCYCAGGLTDGFIPDETVPKIAALADVSKPSHATSRLVGVGLWEPVAAGFQVHDYLKYQPSAEDVRKERVRVAEWRANKRRTDSENGSEHGAYGDPNGVQRPAQNGVRSDVPNSAGTVSRANDVPARPVPSPASGNPENHELRPPKPPRGGRKIRENPHQAEIDELPI